MGVGAVLKAEGDGLRVVDVLPESGASAAGLIEGDLLVGIDGERALTLGFSGSVDRIRGPQNSTVHLAVRRADGTTLELDVPRRRIESL